MKPLAVAAPSCSRPRVESVGMVLKHNNKKAMAAWKYLGVGSN